jgi:hypothetical protein
MDSRRFALMGVCFHLVIRLVKRYIALVSEDGWTAIRILENPHIAHLVVNLVSPSFVKVELKLLVDRTVPINVHLVRRVNVRRLIHHVSKVHRNVFKSLGDGRAPGRGMKL